jgi:Uma2 family endonuclease
MVTTAAAMSLEEFLALPEEKPALEFEDGHVTQKMSPKMRHSVLQGFFVVLVNADPRLRRIAHAFPELRTTFARSSRVPDVAIVLLSRVPRDERGRLIDDVTIPPDIAIEIASPGQSMTALVRRCMRLSAEGVTIVLAVDPDDESILAFRDGTLRAVHRGDDVIDLTAVLPDARLRAGDAFAALALDA